jgi:hypothetical protein
MQAAPLVVRSARADAVSAPEEELPSLQKKPPIVETDPRLMVMTGLLSPRFDDGTGTDTNISPPVLIVCSPFALLDASLVWYGVRRRSAKLMPILLPNR